MDKDDEESDDLKIMGQPPPYTPSYPANPQVVPPTNVTVLPGPLLVPVAGQPANTGGMYHVHAAPVILPMVIGNKMGPKSTSMTCPSCKEVIVTNVEAKPNTGTHLGALVLCYFCCLPFVWVPYFVNRCQNADHYCPACSAYIGSYVHT